MNMDQELKSFLDSDSDFVPDHEDITNMYFLEDYSGLEDENVNLRFGAITSSDREKAQIQVSKYSSLMSTSDLLFTVESMIADNPLSFTQYLRQQEVVLPKKLNSELEDFLNSIGFHNTYDAFAPHL